MLDLSTHKIIESAHVRIDEFVEKSEEESEKEPKDYRKFIYYEPNTLPEERGITILEIIELQKAQIESQSQIVQLELDQECTELLPKQTKLVGIKLIPNHTEHEKLELQIV